ncbi:MAG: hypothetical protein A2X64_05890 [Ignavibacteria bacterium GWF2_33_9]|nr:MAG: hypothetical protein A2X64_05890 [Ignavibacteria bacterium GWF2_33_9]
MLRKFLKLITIYLAIVLVTILANFTLFAETYPTKVYKWQKIGEFNTRLTDTSNYVYSKIQKSSNNFFVMGGRSYGPSYNRSILLTKDFGKTWENIFRKGSSNTDCIIDSKDRLLIVGNGKDSANFIYIRDLNSDITNTITIITKDKNYAFTRIWELDSNNYLIKANDGIIDHVFKFNMLDSGLTQLIPRKNSIDSLDIAIDKDLRILVNISFGVVQNRIIISSFYGNLYYSDDYFKTINFGFSEPTTFNYLDNIQISNGQFLFTVSSVEDTVAKSPILLTLTKFNENLLDKKKVLVNYLNAKNSMDPISMMACSNDKYVVCRMGVSMLNYGYGDTLNVDSLMVSDDYGESFQYVPFPTIDSNYNYFAYASPSITKAGEILLVVPLRTSKGQPSPTLSEVYYGKLDDVGVPENNSKYPIIYPNPTSDKLTISKIPEGVVSYEIFDIFGNRVLSTPSSLRDATPQEGNWEIDVSKLSPGIYFIKIGTQPPLKFVKI